MNEYFIDITKKVESEKANQKLILIKKVNIMVLFFAHQLRNLNTILFLF